MTGKDVIIVDDMISSGESMLDVAKQLKERGMPDASLYARLSDFSQMDLISLMNTMKKDISIKWSLTNLTYLPPVLYENHIS